MDWIVYPFAGIGAFVVFGLIASALYGMAKEALEVRGSGKSSEGQQHVRQCLQNDSFWFSEDVPTMKLLQDLGNGTSVSTARENWRERRKKGA